MGPRVHSTRQRRGEKGKDPTGEERGFVPLLSTYITHEWFTVRNTTKGTDVLE